MQRSPAVSHHKSFKDSAGIWGRGVVSGVVRSPKQGKQGRVCQFTWAGHEMYGKSRKTSQEPIVIILVLNDQDLIQNNGTEEKTNFL